MEYIEILSKDLRMKMLIKATGPLKVSRRKNICLHLCRSIIAQQLSTKVATIIENRFMELLPVGNTSAAAVLQVPTSSLRKIGLSATKANYVHNVARFFDELSLTDSSFRKLDNESVIELLTQIKGVGRWTVEMTLMFALGREDVFAPDDFGIQQSMMYTYRLDPSDKKVLRREMDRIAAAWAPYRTYACLHLWKARDIRK